MSWDLPRETIDINVGGTINLYEAIKAVRKNEPSYDPLVVNACSSAAYGATLRPENVPIRAIWLIGSPLSLTRAVPSYISQRGVSLWPMHRTVRPDEQ